MKLCDLRGWLKLKTSHRIRRKAWPPDWKVKELGIDGNNHRYMVIEGVQDKALYQRLTYIEEIKTDWEKARA